MRIAAYARYSTDRQREASLEDQLRNCRNYAARQGWPAPVAFTDAAITGARNDRPGYRALLARITEFDVVIVDDISRLARDNIETQKAVRRLTFHGVRLIGVSDGVDTARKSHKADVGLRGLMSELYIDELAEKVHRGLTGRALDGASAGGLPYGYQIAGKGLRTIHPAEAVIVRRIFSEYIAGTSPRDIVGSLNRDRVPSPRGGTWVLTAIRGDPKRGIGILWNPIYVGRQIWNRSHWVKHPETGRRLRQERPESEWIIHEIPELAIIDKATWDAAQARQRGRARDTRHPKGVGRPPRHLLSGILRCGGCGGPMVAVDAYRYGCSIAADRKTCPEAVKVKRKDVEAIVLRTIREDLLSEEAFDRFQRQVQAALISAAPDVSSIQRKIAEAERVRTNIMAAIKMGIFTESTRGELVQAEADLAAARTELEAMRSFQPAQFMPRAREQWRRIVDALADHARGIPAAREALHELLGNRLTIRQEKTGDLIAEIAGSDAHINVVAGVGFEPTTFGL